ncbi:MULTISPECIES: TetR/AcrR family transcriptional regulator [unclassified Nocardia]|uniref:TetR/AcrR family transcriptional regulator n=1 Tax=unclassified Nocardia TaxID=2637762 RepID=UPI0024A81632|nr:MULTISPECIES: TetR/AcrR family transcriptional regulator [unclassified Nocardia]
MSGATAPRGRAGRPARLSRESIVAAADRVLRDEGPEALSMRRLAKELDSTAMALYHHVRDKDELLLLVLESHAREIPRLELPDDPRQRLLAAALVLYERLAERPWIVEVLAADPLVVPSAMPMVEVMMAAAVACGHTPEQAVDVYRTLWYYIVGDLVMRANRERRQAAPERAAALDRADALADLDVTALPTVAAVADRWAELTVRDTHRQGLAAIVDGLLPPSVRPE